MTSEPRSLLCNGNKQATVAEKCRTTAGVYLGLDEKGNFIFSPRMTEMDQVYSEPVSIYTVVQKSKEEKKKSIEHGMITGYKASLSDALAGRTSDPTSMFVTMGAGFNYGYKLGYPDGYAAGQFEKNFMHLKPK